MNEKKTVKVLGSVTPVGADTSVVTPAVRS